MERHTLEDPRMKLWEIWNRPLGNGESRPMTPVIVPSYKKRHLMRH